CSMVTGGIVKALRVLDFEPGREFEVVVFSFDPADGPAAARRKRDETLSRIGGDAAAADPPALPGWHFLTGDADSIAALTEAIGFRYTWDEASQQFAHTATLALVTPRGQLSRYYFGLEYAPRDLRLGIIESADEKLGGIAD